MGTIFCCPEIGLELLDLLSYGDLGLVKAEFESYAIVNDRAVKCYVSSHHLPWIYHLHTITITNLLLCGWIISTTGSFTRNIVSTLSSNSLTVPCVIAPEL